MTIGSARVGSLLAIVLLAFASQPLAAGAARAAPTVGTVSGEVVGSEESGVSAFKGIPFAAPPVGKLRWRSPQAPETWRRRDATAFGPACIQPPSRAQDEALGPTGPQSEDCLTLNVWTPSPAADARRPVLVWIHGGGFVSGAGSLAAYNGLALARKGAVVVTINYRLGNLGFFAHPALDRESSTSPANFGLLDQIAALRWVQANIDAFGGDRRNVTIVGESAGAQSVLALFASPLARDLFHRGIAQSPYGIPSHSPAEARTIGIGIGKALGVGGEEASIASLRSIPAEAIARMSGRGQTLAPSLVYGDLVLPAPILERFERGQSAAVPLIIGNNSNEASVAELFGIDPRLLLRNLGLARIGVRLLFPEAGDEADLARLVVRDAVFAAFVKRIADLHSERATAWRYHFSYLPERRQGIEPGVPHGGEIAFVLGTLASTPDYQDIHTPRDDRIADQMAAYWLAFAMTGRPEPADKPEWPPSSPRQSVTMEFADSPRAHLRFHDRRLNILIGVIGVLGDMLDMRREKADRTDMGGVDAV